jgi:hypothetical protein
MSIYVVGLKAPAKGGGAGSDASRSSKNVLNPSTSAGQDSGNNAGKFGQVAP